MSVFAIERKYHLIDKIIHLENDTILNEIEVLLVKTDVKKQIIKPITQDFTLDNIKKQQNYHGLDRKKFNAVVKELDIQESVENLTQFLTP